jgi:hypothetical protein
VDLIFVGSGDIAGAVECCPEERFLVDVDECFVDNVPVVLQSFLEVVFVAEGNGADEVDGFRVDAVAFDVEVDHTEDEIFLFVVVCEPAECEDGGMDDGHDGLEDELFVGDVDLVEFVVLCDHELDQLVYDVLVLRVHYQVHDD